MNYSDCIMDYTQLPECPFSPTEEPTLYKIIRDGVCFDFLIHRQPNCKEAVILGTGAIKEGTKRPIFSRQRWANKIPVTTIYYFNPTLYNNDLFLSWGYGTNDCWYLKEISEILTIILSQIDIDISDVLFFGSSGGGFMSVMLACMMRGKATVFNPQWIAGNWSTIDIERLIKYQLKENEKLIEERLNAPLFFAREGYFPEISCYQNIYCTPLETINKDVGRQVIPLIEDCSKLKLLNNGGRLKITFYSNALSHNGLFSQDETIQIMTENMMEVQTQDSSFFQNAIVGTQLKLVNGKLQYSLSLRNGVPGLTQYRFRLMKDDNIVEEIPYSYEPSAEFAYPPFEDNYSIQSTMKYMDIEETNLEIIDILPCIERSECYYKNGQLSIIIYTVPSVSSEATYSYRLIRSNQVIESIPYRPEKAVIFKEHIEPNVPYQIKVNVQFNNSKKAFLIKTFKLHDIIGTNTIYNEERY